MICIWLGSMSYQITVTGISSASATDYLICAISEPISLLNPSNQRECPLFWPIQHVAKTLYRTGQISFPLNVHSGHWWLVMRISPIQPIRTGLGLTV